MLPGGGLFFSSRESLAVAWIFERTVEVAAWLALIATWVFIGFTLYYFFRWMGTSDLYTLSDVAKCAGAAVAFALALGGLASIDRFLFDADEV